MMIVFYLLILAVWIHISMENHREKTFAFLDDNDHAVRGWRLAFWYGVAIGISTLISLSVEIVRVLS